MRALAVSEQEGIVVSCAGDELKSWSLETQQCLQVVLRQQFGLGFWGMDAGVWGFGVSGFGGLGAGVWGCGAVGVWGCGAVVFWGSGVWGVRLWFDCPHTQTHVANTLVGLCVRL